MRYPDEGEPSRLPWIEDDESVEDALRDVMISHEEDHKEEPEDGDGDGDNGGDGDSPRRNRDRAA
jgi:hypothetical protein